MATDANASDLKTSGKTENNPVQVSMLDGSKMEASHTESGYLTDSVTSGQSSQDKNGQRDSLSEPNSCSENDITPCAENLMVFSDSSNTNSPLSPTKGCPEGSENIQTAVGSDNSEIDQLETLSNIDMNNRDLINEIFTNNFSSNRPETLLINDSNIETSRTHGKSGNKGAIVSENGSSNEGRKRSKSSGFPIPKQKQGVPISEEMLSRSLPHGKVVKRETGMIEFIADDLQEKIRLSSPMSKTGEYF